MNKLKQLTHFEMVSLFDTMGLSINMSIIKPKCSLTVYFVSPRHSAGLELIGLGQSLEHTTALTSSRETFSTLYNR